MSIVSADPVAILDHLLEYVTRHISIEMLLIRLGLDPNNVTFDAIFNRLLDVALASLTFSNILAMIAAIFLGLGFVARSIVLMRALTIVSIVLFLGSAALAGSVQSFFMYLLALPINVIRLVQIRSLVKRARLSEQVSLDWLRPYMTPRNYLKGDVLFHKGDAATEMFLTVTGKFLVTEIGVELPPGRIVGELGFLTPNSRRTQTVECIEDGEVLTITYDKLLEINSQSAEFGYHLLRLTSGRLLQNIARLESVQEEYKAKLLALTAAKPASDAATEPLPVLPGFAGDRSKTKPQLIVPKRQEERRTHSQMFARPRKFLRNVLATCLYWIGWGIAVVVIAWAIILSVISGNPLVALFFGAVGMMFWLIGIGLRYVLARP